LINEWNIQSRSHACQACAGVFTDKQPYHTLLFDERGGFARIDVCPKCWQTQYSQGANEKKGFVSQWQGVYHAPPPPDADPIQKETAETLLRKLVETKDPKHANTCYILAAMLERKRLLKVQSQLRENGRRVFVYEHAKTGDVFTIADPDLQLGQLEAVQHEVALLLERGLDAANLPEPYLPVAGTAQPPVAALAGDTLGATPAAELVEQSA
jgi:hypothetical protein